MEKFEQTEKPSNTLKWLGRTPKRHRRQLTEREGLTLRVTNCLADRLTEEETKVTDGGGESNAASKVSVQRKRGGWAAFGQRWMRCVPFTKVSKGSLFFFLPN